MFGYLLSDVWLFQIQRRRGETTRWTANHQHYESLVDDDESLV